VEVVSPDSVERDYQLKRDAYEQAGVQSYWIIDPDEKRALFLVQVAGRGGILQFSIHKPANC